MKVFMAGGTGLLGSAGARELIKRGHDVASIALPPIPEGSDIPDEMRLKHGNYMMLSDEELRGCFEGCEGFVYASGIDERAEIEKGETAYEMCRRYNNIPLERMLKIAKECGVRRVVVLGSYLSYFDREFRHLELSKHHPYVRSRVEQEELALMYAEDGTMDVSVLQIPYVFGVQKGRRSFWLHIAELIKNSKGEKLTYPKGGISIVTVRQVGQAIVGALENSRGRKSYPLGWYNFEWKELLEVFSKYMKDEKKVITIPNFAYKMSMRKLVKNNKKNDIQTSLNLTQFTKMTTSMAFIDNDIIEKELDVTDDDIEKAIDDTAKLCKYILSENERIVDIRKM